MIIEKGVKKLVGVLKEKELDVELVYIPNPLDGIMFRILNKKNNLITRIIVESKNTEEAAKDKQILKNILNVLKV